MRKHRDAEGSGPGSQKPVSCETVRSISAGAYPRRCTRTRCMPLGTSFRVTSPMEFVLPTRYSRISTTSAPSSASPVSASATPATRAEVRPDWASTGRPVTVPNVTAKASVTANIVTLVSRPGRGQRRGFCDPTCDSTTDIHSGRPARNRPVARLITLMPQQVCNERGPHRSAGLAAHRRASGCLPLAGALCPIRLIAESGRLQGMHRAVSRSNDEIRV